MDGELLKVECLRVAERLSSHLDRRGAFRNSEEHVAFIAEQAANLHLRYAFHLQTNEKVTHAAPQK